MNIPKDLFYTKEHEWARVSGNQVTVGITEYAQSHLGDVTFVELPKIGTRILQFTQLATVESVKAASDVFSPFTGKVIKINEKLTATPELINKSSYLDGWFAVIEAENFDEKKNLMNAAQYEEYCNSISD